MSLRFALTVDEAAHMLGVSPSTVYRSIKSGEVVAERIAGRLVIPARALSLRFGEPVEVDLKEVA